jgi:serine/threonine protein kinase/WD40 repeat protein
MNEESLFVAALERTSADDRRAFLEVACAGDAALRRRLDRLLAANEGACGILDQTSAVPGETAWTSPDEAAPDEGLEPVIDGRYTLLEPIGEGGMGTVWAAEQTDPVRRKVAVKVVKAGMASKSVLARLEAERQALAMMDHPNIAKVLDGGATRDGRPYFVMEYVEGSPITGHCDAGRLGLRERLELFVPVCQAVQHAHQKGVIHRDLKPSNVLVPTYDGRPVPKVIDFGIAKAAGPKSDECATLTEQGQLVGTPLYMSPEQATLGAMDVDTRSDVYALGVLLYEILTGSTPFAAKGPADVAYFAVLRAIREDEPTKPSRRIAAAEDASGIAARRGTDPARLGRSLRGDLDWIVMKALEKDRTRRYETAGALAADLRSYLDHEPVTAGPPTLRYRLRKFVRRHWRPVVAAALVALALVGGFVGTTWNMLRATDALASARRSERDAKDRLFAALLHQARAVRFSRRMGQRRDSLEAVERAARIRRDDRLRDEATAALALPDVRRVPVGPSSSPAAAPVSYGGRFDVVACVEADGGIRIRRLRDDREVGRIEAGPARWHELRFSPDDRLLLGLEVEGRLRVWRVGDGRPVLADALDGCTAFAFHPDGRRLAVGQPGRVACVDLETGRAVACWSIPGRAAGMAFHPEGRELAVTLSDGSGLVAVYGADRGDRRFDLQVGPKTGLLLAWHPDGRRLAVASPDPRIQIWDTVTRRRVATLAGHAQYVTDLTFHPGGDLLASYSWDGVLRLWDPSTGRPALQLPQTLAGRLRFSGDGRWLGAARNGEAIELLEATSSPIYRTLHSSATLGRGAYTPGDISPDGRLLAVGTAEDADTGVRIWDLGGGRELAALPSGTNFAAFDWRGDAGGGGASPDGPRPSLLTCGTDGLLRWPILCDDPERRRLRLGTPRLLSPLQRAWFARSPDGRVLAAVTEQGGPNRILDLETGAVRRELGAHPQRGEVRALSGDGRWAASSGWQSDRVQLWDLDGGRMVKEWPLGFRNFVHFTPDSRVLIIAREDEFSFWDVESRGLIRRLRREVAHFPGHVAFSPDGRLIALEMEPAVIHLVELASGRTVARLEDPHGDRATWQGFTPEGTRLVVVSSYSSAIHIWDLRALRSELATLGLDWDWPAIPSAAPEGPPAESLTVEATPVELTARQKIDRWRRVVEASPDRPDACNALAWNYLMAPAPLRDVEAALPLAERAMRGAPGDANIRNTLGLAYYRAGRYRAAVELVRPNLLAQGDRYLALDLFVLAMAHHRLGEAEQAGDFYRWAIRWVDVQKGLSAAELAEFDALRAEAVEVLGIHRERDDSRGAAPKD